MKKKVAILTLPIGKGYGGILQNFALQYVLRDLEHDVTTISRIFKNKKNLRYYLSKTKNETYNRLWGTYRKVLSKDEIKFVFKELNQFIEENINISEKIYTTEGLSNYFNEHSFNTIIVGSDQTWRPKYSPFITNYFLDFVYDRKDIKKVSYASSFGTEDWEYTDQETIICKKLIQQFDAISVREKSGVDLCKNYLDIEANLVLDPTLLLSKEDYIKLFGNERGQRNGVFSYILDDSPQKKTVIDYISKMLNLPTFKNQPNIELGKVRKPFLIDDYKYPSVERWIMSFQDADFVVTDSFHGTVFSIIFNKPFITIVNEARGASRITSLLSSLGLTDRLIYDESFNYDSLLHSKINYSEVNEKLSELKKKSSNFLIQSI